MRTSRKDTKPTMVVTRSRRRDTLDTGWSWMVLIGSSLGMMMFGLCYTGGIFNIIFLEVFGMSKQATAWVTALQSSLWSIGSSLSSVLSVRIGNRWTIILGGLVGATGYFLTYFATDFIFLFISFGFIVGLGFGICYVPCIAMVGLYFERYRNFSFGVITTAVGVGTMVLPMIITASRDYYGWRGCMLILSGFFLQFLVSGALFRPKQAGKQVQTEIEIDVFTEEVNDANRTVLGDIEYRIEPDTNHSEDKTEHAKSTLVTSSGSPAETELPKKHRKRRLSFLRNGRYLLFCCSLFCVNIACFITFIHYPAYFVHMGASKSTISIYLTVLGVCNIFCRFIGGIATNHKDFDVLLVYIASCGITSIIVLLCPLLSLSYVGQMAFSALFGFYSNWAYSMIPPVTVMVVGVEDLPIAFGVENFVAGFGCLLGPPFAGWLYDVTGTYIYSIYLAGVVYGVGCLLAMMIPVCSHRKHGTVVGRHECTTSATTQS